MDIRIDDILILSNPIHAASFYVLRTEMDLKLRCMDCSRKLMLPPSKWKSK